MASIKSLIFNGLSGFFGWLVVIFDGVKSGEMIDFVGVCRSGYRSKIVKMCGVWEMYVTCMRRVGGTHDHDFKNSNDY